MSTNDPTRRILTEIGEPEDFFGFTLGDLKLLIPAVFAGMLIIGNTPAEIRVFGWMAAGGIVIGMLVLIYAAPAHLATQDWLRARLQYLSRPSILTLSPAKDIGTEESAIDFAPDIEDQRPATNRGTTDRMAERLPNSHQSSRTQDLTGIDRFHVAHRAGKRDDGYVFGAVQVHPANMALATQSDWEQAVRRFGTIVNSLEFPLQIYSTVTPVDPERITQGYRRRLEDQTAESSPEFRTLLKSYQEKLPREFERRGTSIREFYVIVYVSALNVHRELNSVNESGILEKLEELSYVGGFVTTLRASRREISAEEVEAKQVAELDHRLTTVEEEISGLNGVSTTRISTSELAALLKDFWEPGARSDDDPMPAVRTTSVVRGTQSKHFGGQQ